MDPIWETKDSKGHIPRRKKKQSWYHFNKKSNKTSNRATEQLPSLLLRHSALPDIERQSIPFRLKPVTMLHTGKPNSERKTWTGLPEWKRVRKIFRTLVDLIIWVLKGMPDGAMNKKWEKHVIHVQTFSNQ